MSYDCDFLVIGSGLAGLNAALRLAEHGRVVVATKRRAQDNNTSWAQGGIASVMRDDDSIDLHVKDTMVAGAGLCDEQVVREIAEAGPKVIERLVELGVQFDKTEGSFDLTREGGHSARRILHASDITGREIDRALRQSIIDHQNIEVLDHHIAVDVVTQRPSESGGRPRCLGAYVLHSATGEVQAIRAKATLLATGGAGKAYLFTSNPDVATGDGVAMAYRAGADIANMEFVQFHPTCLFHQRAKSFLISEALRGEGGILRRSDGSALMAGLHPMADLAPRDIVARAIDQEMKKSGAPYVTLDMTQNDPAFVAARFPNIHLACMSLGIDMTKSPIPVVPAAHYACGGVVTDLRAQTSIDGLFAAGETAYTGLHGANRLASNSLLEAAVMSERAAQSMHRFADTIEAPPPINDWDSGAAADPDEEIVVSHNWDELRRAMWSYLGIVRSDKRMKRALNRIEMLRGEIHEYYWDFKLTHDLIELRNLADVAYLMIHSAMHRRESRGLHYNIDTPQTSAEWAKPTVLFRDENTEPVWR